MSGSNPYAVNGYSGSSSNITNPYSSSTGRFGATAAADPYLPQNNESNASVNSYGSRDRERRRRSNPYAAQNSASQPDLRRGGGYGGLGVGAAAQQDYGYDGSRDRSRPTPPPAPQQQQSVDDYEARFEPAPLQPRPATRDRDRTEREYGGGGGGGGGGGDTGRTRERRGGILPQSHDVPQPLLPRSANATNGYNADATPRYNAGNSRRPAKTMEEILRHIQSEWKTMEADECVPVKVALQLMDPSSLGLADKEADFAGTHVDLQRCLKSVVNEHYADFNSAVGTYHKIQNAIRESQSRVRVLKSGLMGVQGGMLTTRPELRGLAETSGQLDDMVGLLGVVEELKGVSNTLEERISEKKFLGAVDLLMESLRGLRRGELEEIGALGDMRSYFASQETSLVDILVEELHDHLYLKSPYCAERWKRKTADGVVKEARDGMMGEGVNAWDRPVYHYLSNLDTAKAMVEDASKNPEADTFYYIHMIVESLNKLGHLDEAISRIEQRMPVELYKVVEKTNNEIDSKYPTNLRGQLNKEKRSIMAVRVSDGRSQVLSDFLWTLYSKFEAIAEGHRVLHEVVGGIASREGLAKPEKYTSGFKELWKLYQMEMRSLLHDYLATDGDLSLRTGLTSANSTDVFSRQPRDKNKRMFKLSEMDQKSASVRAEEEELDEILKASVPGLVSKSRAKGGASNNSDRNAPDSTAAGHKLLIEPGVFNMTILLPPSLSFLQHLKDIVPQSSNIPMSTLTSFLDDFLINIFHPQLEEAVTELCTRCMIDMDAFAEDTMWSKHSPHPIFKGTVAFMTLIRSFSEMLSSIPQDQMFTQLIINQLVTYYDRCCGFYKSIVSRVASNSNNSSGNNLTMKAAAAFADSGAIHDVAKELLMSDQTPTDRRALIAKEVQHLLSATKTSPLSSYDIISDPKSVHQLSLLYNSVQWLSSALSQLRRVETGTSSSTKSHSRNTSQPQNSRRWTLVKSIRTPGMAAPSTTGTFLPLTAETSIPFDHTLSSYRMLAQNTLLTLHIDMRCGIIHQLSRVLRGPDVPNPPSSAVTGNAAPESNPISTQTPPTARIDSSALPSLSSGLYPFVLPQLPGSASPLILQLNSDLIAFDANIASYLGRKEHRFITAGLARLVDRYMVVGADNVQVMNANGAERMRVDAMVVQQNLRDIVASSAVASGGHSGIGKTTTATTDTTNLGLGITSPPAAVTSTTDKLQERDRAEEAADALLSSTHLYYTLFLQGPDEIIKYAREQRPKEKSKVAAATAAAAAATIDGPTLTAAAAAGSFTYDEFRTLVELCFSSQLRGDDREEAIKARKRMGEVLLELGEVMWDS